MLSGNSLRQTVHTHCASLHQAAKLAAAILRVAGVTAGLAESNGRFMTHVTCRLTAKDRDQLWNPTLGNRVWATFTFYTPEWPGGVMIRVLARDTKGRGFDSRQFHFQVQPWASCSHTCASVTKQYNLVPVKGQ